MENPLAEILEIQGKSYSRRLSFPEQCGWFIALKMGVSPQAAALAANINRTTAVYLRRPGERVGGQIRYPAVAREYDRLGHEAFVHKYLTPQLRDQIRAAVETLRHQQMQSLNSRGFNPRADKMLGRYDWPQASCGMHVVFRIELHPSRGGYLWRNLKPFHDQPEIPADAVPYNPACQLNGNPERGPERGPAAMGFARSQDAFRYVKSIYDPKE